ncbi:hypothetical protein O6H91_Y013800 [Diphasiastrum complanatum]|nr:hypothetical protein O6H91_Y013800 [Diphasiastrum complanatum]
MVPGNNMFFWFVMIIFLTSLKSQFSGISLIKPGRPIKTKYDDKPSGLITIKFIVKGLACIYTVMSFNSPTSFLHVESTNLIFLWVLVEYSSTPGHEQCLQFILTLEPESINTFSIKHPTIVTSISYAPKSPRSMDNMPTSGKEIDFFFLGFALCARSCLIQLYVLHDLFIPFWYLRFR